jgi:hypothetical protein
MNMLERMIHRVRKSEKAYAAKVRITKNEIPRELGGHCPLEWGIFFWISEQTARVALTAREY